MRSLITSLLLAAVAQVAWAAPVEPQPRIARELTVQVPDGTPDATERRQQLDRLQRDQGFLLVEGKRQSQLITQMQEDVRASQADRARLLLVAAGLGSLLAVLSAVFGVALLRRKLAQRKRGGGAWYRPAPLPVLVAPIAVKGTKGSRSAEAALSPAAWTEDEGAATMPLVREFGRGAAR